MLFRGDTTYEKRHGFPRIVGRIASPKRLRTVPQSPDERTGCSRKAMASAPPPSRRQATGGQGASRRHRQRSLHLKMSLSLHLVPCAHGIFYFKKHPAVMLQTDGCLRKVERWVTKLFVSCFRKCLGTGVGTIIRVVVWIG